ncbi:hypothetical protein KP509_19G055000 [Ceratopteris richardii]|uniref:Uncharacterized protein n=1 Tax=Ceratopteris richardii TaxID=49495 RepID=A0A8T2SNS1_CERRI|nr:hypothetical protein KP509_19G055000 [Ceratopteris richardii]
MAQVKNIGNNGTGYSDGRSKSGVGNKSGGSSVTPQLVLIELKQKILGALNKLADRDTQHIAVEDLERIAEALTPEGISLCLSCLYETDSQQKPAVRKECVKMFGVLASLHEELLAPHLSKIVINIVKRLRDSDSSIRDSCVDTMGTLAAKVPTGSTGGNEGPSLTAFSGPLGIFAKPLFDVLNEQSKSVQAGAALCLAGVIDNLKDPPTGSLQRLCPRIIKLLNSPTFTAKAALLSVISSIVQAGGTTSHQSLSMVMACVQECLKSNDWSTRKAAAETLACMASTVGLPLCTFKNSVLEVLEACRFDKVKPVRDMVIQSLQIWKRVPNSDSEQERTIPVKDDWVDVVESRTLSKKKEDGRDSNTSQKHSSYSSSDCESQDGGCFVFGHSRSSSTRIRCDVQKKCTSHAEQRFSSKVDKSDPENWQIDIALPRAFADTLKSVSNLDIPKQRMTGRRLYQEQSIAKRLSDEEEEKSYGSKPGDLSGTGCASSSLSDGKVFQRNGTGMNKNQHMHLKHSSCMDSASQIEEAEIGSWSIEGGVIGSSSASSVTDVQAVTSESESAFIRQQLLQIEDQQSNIINLLQKLMITSEETLSKLSARIGGVESTVENLLTDLAADKCSRLQGSSDVSKALKRTDVCSSNKGRPCSSDSLLSARGAHILPPSSQVTSTAASLGIDNRVGKGSLYSEAHPNGWRVHVDGSSDILQRRLRNDVEGIPLVNKTIHDRVSTSRLGEGPSARSIWQASKDETTLAAIRVAGEDGRIPFSENLNSSRVPNLATAELRPELAMHKVTGQDRGPFWSLWARAAEFLRSGDVDSAYIEVLCAGDELLLVRLMSRTGPVLEQLSNGTIHELLCTVVQLMLQQSFLDVIIPWVQQVSELVTTHGSECLGLSLDAKRSLVGCLEKASTSSFSEKWIATTIHELAIQLATAWNLVNMR